MRTDCSWPLSFFQIPPDNKLTLKWQWLLHLRHPGTYVICLIEFQGIQERSLQDSVPSLWYWPHLALRYFDCFNNKCAHRYACSLLSHECNIVCNTWIQYKHQLCSWCLEMVPLQSNDTCRNLEETPPSSGELAAVHAGVRAEVCFLLGVHSAGHVIFVKVVSHPYPECHNYSCAFNPRWQKG